MGTRIITTLKSGAKAGAVTATLLALLAGCAERGAISGEIPFPEGYALMPGDRERWAAMSDDQRRRALAFISTGSTIQSSLAPE
ncbi:hypothetical protein [Vannielia litorea]|uniref:hypothetical protein n=1 Tax=Vannielia litorea TaxID=1217970 RepID=UPI001C93EFF0|nr:hypothetical protein [Vannielia litorea]MBY6048282.1 hypothetical protein [Vannielia litorea]MBY6075696.1 hypothetical protein [Vannielia litorea]